MEKEDTQTIYRKLLKGKGNSELINWMLNAYKYRVKGRKIFTVSPHFFLRRDDT